MNTTVLQKRLPARALEALRALFVARPWPSAVLLVAMGVAAAVFGALSVAHSEAQKKRDAFHFASAEVASTLKLAIQREEDLIVSSSAFVSGADTVTPRKFDRWVESIKALQRFPELQNIGLVSLVPGTQLRAFESYVRAYPLRPFGQATVAPSTPFEVFPAGRRGQYCFATAGLARSLPAFLPQSVDYCALAPTLLPTRDSGMANYAPFLLGRTRALGIATPIYAAGTAPSTLAGRRRAFVGWLGVLVEPEIVLGRAREGYKGLGVVFRYHRHGYEVSFSSGSIPARAQSATIDLHNGWSVVALGAPVGGGIFGTSHAWALFAGGTLLSLLVGLLVLTLATARRRALALVREKTAELSHQASHDPLTGLANRALVLESAERMLARSRRMADGIVVAMFIDLDNFKRINDTLGHAAGDELLKVTASRLRATARDADLAGRLGGDEFVVLADTLMRESQTDEMARRMIAALHSPVKLPQGFVFPSVSIGVAAGHYKRPHDLLRDADLALYDAKSQGKNRYVLYEARSHAPLAQPPQAESQGTPTEVTSKLTGSTFR
ncbi:MAG TPA: sensor domain-containing diguanylate cyclase [Solirubrobacteraceae bacterium]|nr:sensor domain-containing diguanylate cyclase [Solirubrobacteraceae bacterium]